MYKDYEILEEKTTQQKIYDFLVKFITNNGYSPSVREIREAVGLKSTSSVYNHLIMLKMIGKIDIKENTSRAIRLIGYKLVKIEKSELGNKK